MLTIFFQPFLFGSFLINHSPSSFHPFLRGNIQQWQFWVVRTTNLMREGEGDLGPDHNFWSKNYHFLFLLPFDAEVFKTNKNTNKKLFDLCVLTLSKSNQRQAVKLTFCTNINFERIIGKLINYFTISMDPKQKQLPQQRVVV